LRVVHVITGLETAGAEILLLKLITTIDRSRWCSSVVSLMGEGAIGAAVRDLGVPVLALNIRGPASAWLYLTRLRRALQTQQPDLVHGWMYHGDLAASLGVWGARRPPVLWSVHHSLNDYAAEKASTRLVIRTLAALSHRPARIVYVASASASQHEALGFASEHRVVIPNGFDTIRFAPSAVARSASRQALGLTASDLVVGLVARFNPVKDHDNFLLAAARVAHQRPEVRFVLAGRDVDSGNSSLGHRISELGLSDRVRLLGEVSDTTGLNAAFDVACSSSKSEGFSSTLGEAMACGTPCVATDVGDSAHLVGDTGIMVPPRDPDALAGGLLRLLALSTEERAELGRRARIRVERLFSMASVAERYAQLYSSVTNEHTANATP
jgi:glycosyltransferase involved in cell wall biosynthesis